MKRTLSFRTKLIWIVMITTCVSLILMSGAIASFEYLRHRRTLSENIAAIANVIGANSTAALSFNDEATAEEILAALKSFPEVRSACLYNAQDHLFAALRGRNHCPATPTPDGSTFAGGVLTLTGPVMLESARIGSLRVVVSQEGLWRQLKLSGWILCGVLLCSSLAGLFLSSRLEGVVSRPILDLASTARRIAVQRDYTLRAPQHSSDEVGIAVDAFNQMLDHIQHADKALRQVGEQSAKQALFLTSILDNMGEAMAVIDREGQILVWNDAAARMLGPNPTVLRVVEWPNHFGLLQSETGPLVDGAKAPVACALAGEVVTNVEVYLASNESRRARWLDATARPLRDEQGVVTGAIAVFRDISQQKQAEKELREREAQLRQAQKMEAIGQLAGGIAHDFNNLMTVVSGYGSIALESLAADSPAREDIEEVLNAGRRAAALTRQLLAFSRKQVTAPQLLNLNSLIGTSEKMLRRLIDERIEFVVQGAANLWTIRADPGQIDQVLLNLIVNSRDAMPHGGRLSVSTSNVAADEQYAREHVGVAVGEHVKLSVSDTGEGMSADVQSRIFEPFFTTKGLGKGTGLGLSTVYGIVQQSGGHISVQSVCGSGTTFDIYFPRVADADANEKASTESLPNKPRGTETILVVEDEPAVRRLVSETFTKLGYCVLTATDGEEALSILDKHAGTIHLLITDVVMPKMSGPKLAVALKERFPKIHVVFMSGYAPESVLDNTEAPRFLIQKPFEVRELISAARQAMDQLST